jgi:hypothetical protein
MPNPKDRLRTVLLQNLYDHHQKARSLKGAGIKISDLIKKCHEEGSRDVSAGRHCESGLSHSERVGFPKVK